MIQELTRRALELQGWVLTELAVGYNAWVDPNGDPNNPPYYSDLNTLYRDSDQWARERETQIGEHYNPGTAQPYICTFFTRSDVQIGPAHIGETRAEARLRCWIWVMEAER